MRSESWIWYAGMNVWLGDNESWVDMVNAGMLDGVMWSNGDEN